MDCFALELDEEAAIAFIDRNAKDRLKVVDDEKS